MDINRYTKIGSYHKKRNEENQDVTYYEENDRFSVIALADGATTCANSLEGARLSCKTIADFLLKEAAHFFDFSNRKIACLLLEQVQFHLKKLAAQTHNALSSYASTLIFCCIDKWEQYMIAFNLGDGALFTTEKDYCNMLLRPKEFPNHCCCLTTTEGAYKTVHVEKVDLRNIDSVLLCSDGVLKQLGNKKLIHLTIQAAAENDYSMLQSNLNAQDNPDDCTFIAIQIQ